jgi:hypothetical protein
MAAPKPAPLPPHEQRLLDVFARVFENVMRRRQEKEQGR